jgi:hypothetical protein
MIEVDDDLVDNAVAKMIAADEIRDTAAAISAKAVAAASNAGRSDVVEVDTAWIDGREQVTNVSPAPVPEDPAATLLDQAKKIVTGARRQSYGNPEDNFQCIAVLWQTYLARRTMRLGPAGRLVITADDVAVMMVLMKTARLAENISHADSWRDIAGYAACGARASKADLS